MWDPRFLPLLYEDLGLRPGITVVDVGCGTGFFTRLVAKGMKDQGHVIGVDIDEKLLRHAKQLSARESLDSVVYKKGNAYDIPFPDNYADLTVSHMLLHWLKDPIRAIEEMRRITKVGGRVAAINNHADISYDPSNPRFNELNAKFDEAFTRGTFIVDGCDSIIARKLPALLKQAGLKEIRANGYATLGLVGDATISKKERQERWRESLEVTKRHPERRERELRYALAGGMLAGECNEYLDLRLQMLEKWAGDTEAASNDMTLSAYMIIVASGRRR